MHQVKKAAMAASVLSVLSTGASAQLEEVVVTASKRVESLQDVSMSISAISGESITRLGATDFNDIATTVPSLSLRSAGPGRTKLNIRGISAATGVAPTVSFYLDEMPIQTISSGSSTSFQQTIIDPKLYDLERVEVLRGPQGTLYGSSSMGGTVRLITQKPLVGENEGSVNLDVSDTDEGGFNYIVNGMYNAGVGDNGALRIVGSYTDRDGYIDRMDRDSAVTYDEDVNNEESTTLRVAYRHEFGDAYIQPFVFYQKTEMDGKPSYDGPHSEFEQVREFDAPEPYEDEFTMANLTYGQDFGSVSLLASLSNIDREFTNVEDITDPTFAIFGYVIDAVYADEKVELDDTTFEARLTSNSEDALTWLGGVYYKDSEADAGYRMQRGFDPAINEYGLANTQDLRTYEEIAVFGELGYDITERFNITAGLRYLDYDYEQFKEDWGWAFTGGDRDTANELDLSISDDDVNGKLTATYHFTDVSQFYGTWSTGSRPGGGNRTVPRSEDPANSVAYACDQDLKALGISGSPDSYEGDEVTNYELGWKSDLTENIRFNGAFYLMEWEDIQQNITTSGECGVNFTANLGEAESKGVELELVTLLTDNFTLSAATGYTDAVFKETVESAGISKDDKLADVPEWTVNVTLDYIIPVSYGEYFVVFNYNWVDDTLELPGKASSDVSGNGIISGNVKPSYEIMDLRLGFASDNNWEALLYVDNLADEEAIYTYSDALAFNIGAYDRTVRNRPRTIGASFTYNF
ncbi:TonB-dependent receptor [Seongchinamella unica]|uniref:TonB-dependent receptor n=1 Tax=Seongchinamella unica TaxID=2547392 RepID=A0A4R5LSD1_9GAMM|nr:TonB-dependent receptor [Seongchinamella unica]TDG13627.1 TonB-dependent receptor [Seongchinamella unica]